MNASKKTGISMVLTIIVHIDFWLALPVLINLRMTIFKVVLQLLTWFHAMWHQHAQNFTIPCKSLQHMSAFHSPFTLNQYFLGHRLGIRHDWRFWGLIVMHSNIIQPVPNMYRAGRKSILIQRRSTTLAGQRSSLSGSCWCPHQDPARLAG